MISTPCADVSAIACAVGCGATPAIENLSAFEAGPDLATAVQVG